MRVQGQMIRITFIALLAILFFVNCGDGVQIHGNTGGSVDDGGESSDDAGNDGEPSPISDQQPLTLSAYKDAICDVIASCFNAADATDCADAAEEDLNLLAAFGGDGTFVTFTEVDDAIQSGDVDPETTALTDCEAAIADIECADAAVLSAYDENSANDYSDINEIVPAAACGDLI